MFPYSYDYNGLIGSSIALLIVSLLCVAGGIVLYFTFLNKKNEYKFTGFSKWIYDFLSFKKLILDGLLKILYIITALFMTFGGIVILFLSPLTGLSMITLGNIFARLAYEFSIMIVMICRNTNEINAKMGPNKYAKHAQAAPAPAPNAQPQAEPAPYAQPQAAPTPFTPSVQNAAPTAQNATPTVSKVTPAPADSAPVSTSKADVIPTEASDPNICPECGTPYKEDAIFCTTCGHKR